MLDPTRETHIHEVYLRARKFLLLPLLDSVQEVLVLELRHVRVEVQVPLLGLTEQLLEQEDVGVTRVEELALHLAPDGLVHGLDDLLDLVGSEGVVIDPDLLGVRHGGLDTLEALAPLVFGKLDVGHELSRMVLVNFILGRLKNIQEKPFKLTYGSSLPCRQNCRNQHNFTVCSELLQC